MGTAIAIGLKVVLGWADSRWAAFQGWICYLTDTDVPGLVQTLVAMTRGRGKRKVKTQSPAWCLWWRWTMLLPLLVVVTLNSTLFSETNSSLAVQGTGVCKRTQQDHGHFPTLTCTTCTWHVSFAKKILKQHPSKQWYAKETAISSSNCSDGCARSKEDSERGWKSLSVNTAGITTCYRWVHGSCRFSPTDERWEMDTLKLPEDCLFWMAKQKMNFYYFFLEEEKKLKQTELWSEEENIHCVK